MEASQLPAVSVFDPKTGEVIGVLLKPGAVVLDGSGNVAFGNKTNPRLGGLATPIGVYLHDGVSSGGPGFKGLLLTGVLMAVLGILSEIAAIRVYHILNISIQQFPWLLSRFTYIEGWFSQFFEIIVSSVILLTVFRISPISGFHAAEHQVVHCIEQGVPLTIPYVRSMPRVHPRCGTNLFIGLLMFLFMFIGTFITAQIENLNLFDSAMLAVVIAAPVTIKFWRTIGGFVQYWLATKPATDKQILNAIQAANEILDKRQSRSDKPARNRFLLRIWSMGAPQVIVGYAVVCLILKVFEIFWPGLGAFLEMY